MINMVTVTKITSVKHMLHIVLVREASCGQEISDFRWFRYTNDIPGQLLIKYVL